MRGLIVGLAVLTVLLITLVGGGHAQTPPHLLFGGGRSHDTFLGCLNCDRFDSTSVCNEYGQFGNVFRPTSIWNPYGPNSMYSQTSPWNQFAIYPPVIVDRDGNFYGYFTANTQHDKRTRIRLYQLLTDAAAQGRDLATIRDVYCDN